jgi:hypothetical protein
MTKVGEESVDFAVRKMDFSLSADGEDFKEEEEQPSWAGPYWNFKSSLTSPDGAEIKRDASRRVESSYRLSGKVVGRPWYAWRRTAALDKHLTADHTRSPDAATRTSPSRGLGETRSGPEPHLFYPGMTWSWSPPGGNAIVYYDDFKVRIMSNDGKVKKKIASGDYYLPAWSHDGKKVAFIRLPTSEIWDIHVVELTGIEYQDGK